MRDNTYSFLFAVIVCFVCSLSLSIVSQGLKSRQIRNEELDMKRNVLKAVKLADPIVSKASGSDILKLYADKIKEIVVGSDGNIVEGKTPADIESGSKEAYPLFIYSEEGKARAYCFPISGKGLWSTIYGYMALEPDAATVRGVTFYKHGETPGLGAEVEKEWFQNNFRGKKIYDKGALVSIVVVKGKVLDKYSPDAAWHYVDGISGASMTCKGVTAFVKRDLEKYDPFLRKVRKSS